MSAFELQARLDLPESASSYVDVLGLLWSILGKSFVLQYVPDRFEKKGI